jgi:hypothetical protein
MFQTLTFTTKIPERLNSINDNQLIEGLFQYVKSEKPRRCRIKDEKEIIIQNYYLWEVDSDDWNKVDYLMTNLNKWSYVINACINIQNNEKNNSRTISYKINSKRLFYPFFIYTAILLILPIIIVYLGTSSIINGLEIGGFVALIFIPINTLLLIIIINRHKRFLKDGLTKIKTFAISEI